VFLSLLLLLGVCALFVFCLVFGFLFVGWVRCFCAWCLLGFALAVCFFFFFFKRVLVSTDLDSPAKGSY